MNLNPLNLIPKRWLPQAAVKDAGALPGSTLTRRESQEQGMFSAVFQDYVPREVNPRLYEAMREAVPTIDGAITWMNVLDGIVRVEGANKALVQEIRDWADTVPVNDANLGCGLQLFYLLMSNEMYEQGYSVGQWIPSADGRDIAMLKVANSVGGYFQRPQGQLEFWYRRPRPLPVSRNGIDNPERILRNTIPQLEIGTFLTNNGYHQVDLSRAVYCAFNPENDNPYGVSLMRSMEFDTRILLTIKNAVGLAWGRFGDPSFHVSYKTGNRRVDGTTLDKRRDQLASDFKQVLEAKRSGNSADFTTGVGADDTIEVKIIGGDGQILELEMPAKVVMSQLLSKTHLAAWMLNMDFSAAARMAPKQSELILQDSKTRWELRKPALMRLVATILRMRGRTWKPGDWDLVQELPNIADTLANAQAEFYLAQAALMRSGAGLPPAGDADDGSDPQDDVDNPGEPDNPKLARLSPLLLRVLGRALGKARKAPAHGHKESFAQQDPMLPKLEAKAEVAAVAAWRQLGADTLKALGLGATKAAKAAEDDAQQTYIFDASQIAELEALQQAFVESTGGADSDLIQALVAALGRGVANGASEFDADAVSEAVAQRNAYAMRERGLSQVRDTAAQAYRGDIVAALADGEYDGMAPDEVAAALAQRFDLGEYNWRRLAHTEVAQAQVQGKLDQYQAQGVDQYDWVCAPDACPICQGLAEEGPYSVGSGPSITDDSHPECRCTVEAHQE